MTIELDRRGLLAAGLATSATLATAGTATASDAGGSDTSASDSSASDPGASGSDTSADPRSSSLPTDGSTRITDISLKDLEEQAAESPQRAIPRSVDTASSTAVLPGAPARRADIAATLVACSWSHGEPDAIEVRSRSESGEWSEWIRLVPLADEDTPATEPAWIGPSTAVDVRASRDGADATADVTAHLIATSPRPEDDEIGVKSSGGKGSGRGTPITVSAGTPTQVGYQSPQIYSREAWGADESLAGDVSAAPELKAGVVHHTEGTNDYTESQSAQIIRGIYAYHTQTQGWDDIGYNVLVDKFGRIFEGRHGGLEKNIVGAHARGFNTGSFGVSVMGSFMNTSLPSAARDAVCQVIAWKLNGAFCASRTAKATFKVTVSDTKFPNGSTASLPRVFSHRDVNYTDCPGNKLYPELDAIRSRVWDIVSDSYHGHLDAFRAAGGGNRLGTVTDIAKINGDYEVTRLTKGLVLSKNGGSATGYVSSFAPEWQSAWGAPIKGSDIGQVCENGTAVRKDGRVYFTKGQRFTDVWTTHPYFAEINEISDKGISTGWNDGTYRPTLEVQRNAMLAFLYRAMGSPDYSAPSTSPFSDASPDSNFYKEMCWAFENDYVTGWDTGTGKPEIRPLDAVARDAMAAFLYRAADADTSAPTSAPFSDVPTSYPYAKEIAWMKDRGISTGWSDGTYRPHDSTSRDAMAAFLIRWLDVIG